MLGTQIFFWGFGFERDLWLEEEKKEDTRKEEERGEKRREEEEEEEASENNVVTKKSKKSGIIENDVSGSALFERERWKVEHAIQRKQPRTFCFFLFSQHAQAGVGNWVGRGYGAVSVDGNCG